MTFDDFYALYPRRIAKAAAFRAWNRLKPDEALQAKIAKALEWQGPAMKKRDPKYVPHPATWLNQARWDDEPDSKQAIEEDAPPSKGGTPIERSTCKRCGRSGVPLSRIGRSWNFACEPFCEQPDESAQPPRPPAA